jgi:hypothetical protein
MSRGRDVEWRCLLQFAAFVDGPRASRRGLARQPLVFFNRSHRLLQSNKQFNFHVELKLYLASIYFHTSILLTFTDFAYIELLEGCPGDPGVVLIYF